MAERILVGVDIGGTKCAVTLGLSDSGNLQIKDKVAFPTTDVEGTIRDIKEGIRTVLGRNSLSSGNIAAIGVGYQQTFRIGAGAVGVTEEDSPDDIHTGQGAPDDSHALI